MRLLFPSITILMLICLACKEEKGQFVCTPCDLECDLFTYKNPGKCEYCGMDLINKSELHKESLKLNEADFDKGSGSFLIEGGKGHSNDTITVFYHLPKNFTNDSKVLLVIPGAGRNGDSYRDAWVEESEKYGVLVLSPQYPEKTYPFEAYHLGGIIDESNLRKNISFIPDTNIAELNENGLEFTINSDTEDWIFNDFDRIFDLVKNRLSLSQNKYDLFGHSAGGHILHRFALFYKGEKVNRIFACNASFYTLPDMNLEYPFGLLGTSVNEEMLKKSFQRKLFVTLGEQDNENENGGTFLRSLTADKQGLHRLARGKYFFKMAKDEAKRLNYTFNWELLVIPNVGHDHKLMGNAVGDELYGTN